MTIRPMTPEDLEQVNRLVSESLHGGPPGADVAAPLRTSELLALCQDASREGGHVAEVEGDLAGAAFTRLWGRTGWIGPLVVEDRHQGKGLGTALLEEAVEALRGAGATVVGTEIPITSERGVGFLVRRGFRPHTPTLELEKSLEGEGGIEGDPPEPTYFSALMEDDRRGFLEDVRRLCASLDTDLDYAPQVQLVERHGMGDSLLLRSGERPVGLAVCHTRPHAAEGEPDLLRVEVLCLDEVSPFPSLEPLLGVVGLLAREVRSRRVRIPVPARSWEALRLLTERGYRVRASRLRMTLVGYPERGEAGRINLARWA